MEKVKVKNCTTCAWNGNKGVCDKYRIVPMSADGKGRKDCEGWDKDNTSLTYVD